MKERCSARGREWRSHGESTPWATLQHGSHPKVDRRVVLKGGGRRAEAVEGDVEQGSILRLGGLPGGYLRVPSFLTVFDRS